MEALKWQEAKISKWRSESILDIYNFSFATFLFISPWLFAYAQEIARIDILVKQRWPLL